MASRNTNLKKARKLRTKRGQLFAQLESGTLDLVGVIEEPQKELEGVDLYDILRRAKGFRKAKAKTVCLTASVWPHDTLGQLSVAERARIIDCIKKLQS